MERARDYRRHAAECLEIAHAAKNEQLRHLPENGGGLVGLGTQKSDRSRRGIEVHLAQLLAVRALLCLRLSLLR
jgi:hypothetical protein